MTYDVCSFMGFVFTNLFVGIGILLPLCGIRISEKVFATRAAEEPPPLWR
jgi:hypothetical protein